jgi:hypothetical protein
MILVLVVVSLVAVSALAFLAWRYGEMVSARPVGEPAGASRTASGSTPVDGEAPPEASAENLDAFLSARGALLAVLKENPVAFESLCQEIAQDTRDRTTVPMYPDVLLKIRLDRAAALKDQGRTEDEYKRIREQYRRWLTGDDDVDPGWAARFDESAERLGEVDLGRCEGIDY